MKHFPFARFTLSSLYPKRMHGSLVIAAIASDGAVLAADSRVAIKAADGTVMGYFDGLPKIQLLAGKYPVAAVGQTLIGEKFINAILADFGAGASPHESPETLFRAFQRGFRNTQPRFTNTFFGAGYVDDSPQLYGFTSDAFYRFPSGATGNSPGLLPYVAQYNGGRFTCAQCREELVQIIYRFAKEKHKEHEIGGPVSVIKIGPNNKATWIQNDLSQNNFADKASFLKAVEKGAVSIVPVNGFSPDEVFQALLNQC